MVSVLIVIGYLVGLTRGPTVVAWLIGVPVVLAVLGILGITAWIGWTMLTTPPPAPLESELSTPIPTPTTAQTGEPMKTEDKNS